MKVKDKIEKYVKQRWFGERDIVSSAPFMPMDLVNAINRGSYLYRCIMRFRKKSSKKTVIPYTSIVNTVKTTPFDLPRIEVCYGLCIVTDKSKSSKGVKSAIKAMLKYAKDNYGFNWKDFEVRNINTGEWEIAI